MATAMSAPSKRKGRTSSSGRWRSNQSDQWNMPPRNPSSNQSRNPVDSFKSGKMRITNDDDGVFGNGRFVFVAACLIGTPVSIQVKNGNVYEGIFRTFSQKMEIILSVAHKVDDRLNPNNNSVIPNKENVIDNLIIKSTEIVKLDAKNVDLDYAVKEPYSESSSRLNGQLPDKDLTPWEGDIEDGKMTSLESDASNGWDPSDMFKTNYEQFNVKSTYDENLSQYTTPLEKRDTKEYKEREEAAAKLADEIERSDSYRHRISLENGEGEDEEKFAAVIKPEISNNNNAGIGRNPGRKIPNRSGGASLRGGSHSPSNLNNSNPVLNNNNNGNISNSSSSREILCNTTQSKPCISIPASPASAPSTGSQQQQPQVTPPPPPPSTTIATTTASTQQPQSTSAALQQITSSQPQIVQPSHSNYSQQAQSREQQPPQPQSLPLQPQVSKVHDSPVISPTLESIKVNGTSEKEEKECSTDRSPAVPAESKDTVHAPSVSDDCRRNSNTKGERAMEIQALKQFSSNIKLSGDKDKEREKQERQDKSEERKETDKNKEFEKSDKLSAKVKNSTLNPNAKEFNPKTYPQKHCAQTPPPPRPQTQSPVAISAVQSQQLFGPYPVIMPMQATPQQATNQSNRFTTTKRIVSVPRHDFNAQAAAATGQPLLAQTGFQTPYFSYLVPPPTPTHYPQHMMTMTPGSRLTPSVPLVPTSHPGPMEQTGNHQHSAQPVFVASAGPVPTHVQHHPNHGPMPHPTPTHMGHHPGGGHTQGNQINTQGSGHPAQSPVQTQGPSSQQSQHPQHPPSSGTPQPQPPNPMNYQPMSIQGHPPLQGSPHNPTSPPSVHPVSPYPLPSHSHMQATGAQMSVPTGAQGHPQTSVTHSQMHTHSPHVNQQIVMMPQPPAAHPHTPQHMQPQPVPTGHHFQGHPMPGSHVHSLGHHIMATQPATAIPVSTQSNVHQGQMHILPVVRESVDSSVRYTPPACVHGCIRCPTTQVNQRKSYNPKVLQSRPTNRASNKTTGNPKTLKRLC